MSDRPIRRGPRLLVTPLAACVLFSGCLLGRAEVSMPSPYTDEDAGTGYEVVKPTGIIRRIEGAGVPRAWDVGHRAIKVVYSAGYADPASVPARIKSVALRYVACPPRTLLRIYWPLQRP